MHDNFVHHPQATRARTRRVSFGLAAGLLTVLSGCAGLTTPEPECGMYDFDCESRAGSERNANDQNTPRRGTGSAAAHTSSPGSDSNQRQIERLEALARELEEQIESLREQIRRLKQR